MKKIIFLIGLGVFLNAEPSAFMAGDLNSANPYGLTKDEQFIYKNKQNIQKLQQLVKSQAKEISALKLQFLNYKMKVDNMSQKIDGMQSLLPNFDNVNLDIATLKQDLNQTNDVLFKLKDEVKNLNLTIISNKKINENNTQTIIALVEKLANNLDKMQAKVTTKNNDYTKWNNTKIFNKAFSYFKSYKFSKAKELFNYLYSKKYKPATILFYLGEIEYRRGNYKTALSYYKKSIQTYSKPASFTAELLYHTGYSLEKLGHKQAAISSYLKIVNDYPNSIFVKYAKKRAKDLKNK